MSAFHVYHQDMATAIVGGPWFVTAQLTGEGGFTNQVRGALEQLAVLSAQAGVETSGYVKATVLLTDGKKLPEFLKQWSIVLAAPVPALTVISERALLDKKEFSLEVIGVTKKSGVAVSRFYSEEDREIPCAVRAGDYVFASAQSSGCSGDLGVQTDRIMSKLSKALMMAGCTLENAVKNRVFLTDCSLFSAFNKEYSRYYNHDNNPPARSLMGITEPVGGEIASMDLVAYTGDRRRVIRTDKAPGSPTAPYCQAVQAGNLVFISGQVGRNVEKNEICHPLGEESRQTFENITTLAQAGGVDVDHIIKTNSFLINAEDYMLFSDTLKEQWKNHAGANAFYLVGGLATTALLVEMDAVGFLEEE